MKIIFKKIFLIIIVVIIILLLGLSLFKLTNGFYYESISPNFDNELKKIGLPVRLRIPKLKIDAAFQYIGLTTEGAIDSPTNIEDVGWYKIGSRPGEKGSAIITGHFAKIRNGIIVKNGVFNNLNKLQKGDYLYIEDDKGKTISFVVKESRIYDSNVNAPEIFKSDNGVHLNLITCAGEWDKSKKNYTKRLVIFTDVLK